MSQEDPRPDVVLGLPGNIRILFRWRRQVVFIDVTGGKAPSADDAVSLDDLNELDVTDRGPDS